MAGARIQLKRALAAAWTAADTVLLSGEIGYELDTDKFKIGDGALSWTALDYFNGNLSGSNLNDLADVTITSAANGDFLRWNGSAWINDAVNLSTDTVGDYVGSLVAGTGVTLANNSGEGATPTVTVDTTVIQARVTDVSDTEIGYLNGVTSSIQTQLNSKPLIVPLTNKVYIDYLRADSYTATGTREYPYKTLAAAYTAAATVVSSSNPMVLVLLSGNTLATAENITFTKGHLFLTAENSSGTHAPTIFCGSLTFTGPNTTIGENHFAISNLELVGVSGTPVITFSGSYPQRLFIKDTWITAEGSAHGITMTNSGTYSSVHMNDSKFSHNGSGHYHCVHVAAGTANLDSIETSGANVGVIGIDGGTCNLSNSEITSGGTYAIDIYAGGSLTTANCKIVTTAANSSGIKLNTATAYAVLGNTFFNVPTSVTTGRAIYGVAGTALYYSNLTFSPGSNLQIDSAITKTQIDDFGGPKATYTAAAAYTDAAISGLIDSAPGALNTLNELAAAINDDASYAATITTALGLKAPLDNPTFTGTVTVPDNTIALGTKTTGDYVATITGGTGIASTASTSGEGTTHTLSIGQSVATSDSPTFAGLNLNGDIVFEGITANAFETTISVTDPTADRTVTFQDATGTVVLRDSTDTLTNKTLTSPTVSGLSLSDAQIVFEGATADDYETTLVVTDPTADRTITFPNATGTVALNGTIALGTDTTGNYMSDVSVQNGLTVSHTPGEGSTATVGVDNALMTNYLLDGAAGNSYGLIGTSTYLDIKNTNGYNKEIELDIAAVETKLNTDGYLTESSTSTLTNKTLTSPKINENVVLSATATELNVLDGITSSTAELNILDGVTATASEINTLDGITSSVSELNILDGATLDVSELNTLDGITSSTAELNILDGALLDVNELNILNGVTATTAEINILDGATLDVNELNILDGVTATASEINILDGATLSVGELNILDGATLTTTELNYVDGVTSAIQTQIDTKAPIASPTFTGTVTLPADPSSALHAATKQYVDNVTAGINFHEAAHAASSSSLSAIYNNGTAGVGATLTADTDRAFGKIDNESVAVGQRVLIKNQVDAKQNGIYTLTTVGSGSIPWVLTRATDADNNPSGEMKTGDFCFVTDGATNGGYGFVNSSTANPIVIGTDNITFTQFNTAQIVVGGAGLAFTGNTLDIGTASTSRIVVNADNIDLASGVVSIGTYNSVTVDTYGRVTAGTNPTTLSGYGITDAAPINNASFTGTFSAPTGTITSTMISDGTIVNGDINSSAAIALSKLASGTSAQVIVASSAGVPTYVTLSGDVTISDTGVATIQANSVALGTDTTGSYVTSLVAGTGITLSNNSGESATPTVAVTANTYDAYGSARNLEIKFLMEVM